MLRKPNQIHSYKQIRLLGDCRSGGGGDSGTGRGKEGQDGEKEKDKVPLNSRASQGQSCNGGFLTTSKGCVHRETSGDAIGASVPELTFTRTGRWERESLTLRLDLSGALTMVMATAGPG